MKLHEWFFSFLEKDIMKLMIEKPALISQLNRNKTSHFKADRGYYQRVADCIDYIKKSQHGADSFLGSIRI